MSSPELAPAVARTTRSQLHALVWDEPMTKVAKRFGVSGVALAKLCDRHGVPRPAQGHWAKLAAGQAVSKEALPQPHLDEVIHINRSNDRVRRIVEKRGNRRASDAEGTGLANIQLPQIANVYLERIREGSYQQDGWLLIEDTQSFRTKISKHAGERAEALMRSLFQRVIAAGMEIREGDKSLLVVDGDQAVPIELKELSNRVPHHATPSELAALAAWEKKRAMAKRRGQRFSDWDEPVIPDFVRVPSGKLEVVVDPGYQHDRLRLRFRDGNKQRVEGLIERIIDTITACAEEKRESELRSAEQRNADQLTDVEGTEQEDRNALVAKRAELFNSVVNLLFEANSMQQRIDAYRNQFASSELPSNVESLLSWLETEVEEKIRQARPEELDRLITKHDLMSDGTDAGLWTDATRQT